jgi:hypothetical protein
MGFQHCPRCQRANPGEARFCHYDGAELRAVGGGAHRGGDLGQEFVFPTGRRCKTYDDLIRVCSEEWTVARDMLRKGGLRQFLAGVGRMDLAMAAQQATAQSDLDIALDNFLAQLPSREAMAPKLDLVPRRINLGKLGVGDSRQFQLTVINQGVRLLHGTIQVEGGDWIKFEGQGTNGTVPVKTGKQQTINLQVDTFGLVAGQQYTARLTVITNGGAVEVPIRLEMGATPFAKPPLAGVTSPRDLAARMKTQPKQSVPLLENGEIMRWFAANGWRYPIQGPPAKGVAAVQQFFEGMGLSKPPLLALSSQEVLVNCRTGQTVKGFVTLKTAAKKWVFAQATSDSPWLTVLTPDAGGAQQAKIDFEVTGRGLAQGKRHEGKLAITSNGGQQFTVLVRVEVPVERTSPARRYLRPVLVGALLFFLVRFLVSLPDPYARGWRHFGTWLDGRLSTRLGVVVDKEETVGPIPEGSKVGGAGARSGAKAAVVARVLPGSPADKAGLQADDKILLVNDVLVLETKEHSAQQLLTTAVQRAGANHTPVSITVERAYSRQVGAAPAADQALVLYGLMFQPGHYPGMREMALMALATPRPQSHFPRVEDIALNRSSPPEYVRRFTLATAWLGVPLGMWFLWRRSGYRDLLVGAVVGAATGLAASATLACFLKGSDAMLRWLLPFQAPGTAIVAWTLLGAATLLLLGQCGARGRAIVSAVCLFVSGLFRKAGLTGAADYLAAEE